MRLYENLIRYPSCQESNTEIVEISWGETIIYGQFRVIWLDYTCGNLVSAIVWEGIRMLVNSPLMAEPYSLIGMRHFVGGRLQNFAMTGTNNFSGMCVTFEDI